MLEDLPVVCSGASLHSCSRVVSIPSSDGTAPFEPGRGASWGLLLTMEQDGAGFAGHPGDGSAIAPLSVIPFRAGSIYSIGASSMYEGSVSLFLTCLSCVAAPRHPCILSEILFRFSCCIVLHCFSDFMSSAGRASLI